MKIMFNTINDISCFNKGCEYYEGEIIARQGEQVVNAKSVLGLYSLVLTRPIDIIIKTCRSDTENNFYNFIKKWEVEE